MDHQRDIPDMSAIQQALLSYGGAPSDPNFASVLLLVHADGTNGSTTFPDNSSYARTLSSQNSAAVATASPKFGTGALQLTASNQALNVPHSTDFNYGTGDFTIEFWYRPANVTGNKDLYAKYNANPSGIAVQQRAAKLHILGSFNGTSWGMDTAGSSDTLAINTWSFVQVVRTSGVFTVNVDGVTTITNSSFTASSLSINTQGLQLGNNYVASGGAIGMFDDYRITKGVARANAVPTTAFPNF
jgi:hypothetical protein